MPIFEDGQAWYQHALPDPAITYAELEQISDEMQVSLASTCC